GGGSGEATLVQAWRGSTSAMRSMALLSSVTVWEVPSIAMSLPAMGGVGWSRPSTYPVKVIASFCSVLMLYIPTHSVGAYQCRPPDDGSSTLVRTSHPAAKPSAWRQALSSTALPWRMVSAV